MAELLRNPLSMAKACEELRRVIGSRRNIEESEIGQLPYLQAVIKETQAASSCSAVDTTSS
jgi:cytochrome P450